MQGFLIALLECSLTMSVLVLCFMALTPRLSKRYSAQWLYYAWLVIAVGLLIPFRFHPDTALIHTSFSAVSPAAQQTVSLRSGMMAPAQKQGGVQGIISDHSPTAFDKKPGSGIMNPWYRWVGLLWMAGAIIFIAFHGIRHRRFLHMVRRWNEKVSDEPARDIMQNQKLILNISKPVELRACTCITSPIMIGLIKPMILLPPAPYSEDELSLIFRHELVHLKRKDLWYKILVLGVTALHWFNPVIYLMARAIAVQCEISCDMEVVKGADSGKRQQYSETILNVIKNKPRLRTAFSTNFWGGKEEMKNRILSIMDRTKKRNGIFIICAVLLVTMGSGTIFAAGTNNTKELKPLTEYGGAIITYYNPFSTLETNVLSTLGVRVPGSKVQIKVTSSPNYIDINGREIDYYNRTEPYYRVQWNWMSKNSEAQNLVQKTLTIEGKKVTMAFSDQASGYKEDKVIEKMCNNLISFASVYQNKTYDYDYKAFMDELTDRGICVIQEVTTPENFGWRSSITKNTGFWANKLLTQYDGKDKITSVYNGKILVPPNINGNQGVQIGSSFTVRAGETLALDIKQTTDKMPTVNWAIVDITAGKTMDWMPNALGGNRYVWTPGHNYVNHTFKVITSTEEMAGDNAVFEIFTYQAP